MRIEFKGKLEFKEFAVFILDPSSGSVTFHQDFDRVEMAEERKLDVTRGGRVGLLYRLVSLSESEVTVVTDSQSAEQEYVAAKARGRVMRVKN